LKDGNTYYYKVSAVDDGGPIQNEGMNSTVKSAIPSDTTPPSQVTGVTVIIVPTGNELNIQWNDLSGTVADLAGYRVYRSTTSGCCRFSRISSISKYNLWIRTKSFK